MLHLFQGMMLCQVLVYLHILCQCSGPSKGYSYLMSRLHKAREKCVLCGWKWAEELCVYPDLGTARPPLVRRAEVGWEHTEMGPASAGTTTVSKRVMHWKIDMFLGTAESYCVFPISKKF